MSGSNSTGKKRKKDDESSSDEDIWKDFAYFIVKGKKITKDSSDSLTSGSKSHSETSVKKKKKSSQLDLSSTSSSSKVVSRSDDDDSSMQSFQSENESGVESPLGNSEMSEIEQLRRENSEFTQEIAALRAELDKLKGTTEGNRLLTANDKRRKGKGPVTKHTTVQPSFDPNNKDYMEMITKLEETGKDDDDKWHCPSCNISYSKKRDCVGHVEDFHFGRQHPCLQCPQICASYTSLKHHVNRLHKERDFRYTKALPGLETVLFYENGQITSSKFEDTDRDNLFVHWLCEYKSNPLTGEPAPHKFCSGYHWLLDAMSMRSVLCSIKNKRKINQLNVQKREDVRTSRKCSSLILFWISTLFVRLVSTLLEN